MARGNEVSMYFGENKVEAGHGRRSVRGGAVSLAARGINAFIQIGSVLFLARLLTPEDYGLVSMVAAITGIANGLIDLGTHDAIVQRPRITEGEISALFWITAAIGGGCTLLAVACGPLFAWFYREPRLTMITAVSAITFIASALTYQHYALMRRAMKFHELAVIEVVANLLSAGLAVTIAFRGFHYWALVLRPIASASFLAAGLWVRCRWVPGRPTMTSGVKEMVKFGLHSAGFTLTDSVGGSSDRVAIGYRSGPRSLGYYQNAMFVYGNLLDVLVFPLHSVAVSSLSKVRDDLKEFRRLWGKALSTLAFYAMPAFGLLAVTSRDLIVLLLGTKWSQAGILLSILALRGIPHVVERSLGWLHVSAGRSDRWMRYGLVAVCVQILALFSGLPFGPTGVVTAYVISMFLLFVPAIAYAGRPMDIGAKDVVKVVWRQLAGALIAAATGFVLRYTLLAHTSGILRTAGLTLVYLTVYLVIVVGLFRVRTPVGVVLKLIRDVLPARLARFVRTPAFIDRHSYEQLGV
jgi:PST family polysaccharide transporter